MDFTRTDRKVYVRDMFGAIASTYDLMNRLMTGGLDQRWRKKVARLADPKPGQRLLDLATGTGDLAVALLDQGGAKVRVIGLDFSSGMIRRGAHKFSDSGGRHQAIVGDLESMSFRANRFDAVTIGFGVRNLGDIPRGLSEMYRVLRPGGRLVILEASTPRNALVARCTRLHTEYVLPLLGRLVSGNREAYSYLPWSVEQFPARERVLELLREAGFTAPRYDDCFLGVATIFSATKPMA